MIVAFAALSLLASVAKAGDLTVSAAASLSSALKELAPGFEAQHPGTKLLFNFAASDALLAQIAKGAPVDVFASADQDSMDKAQAQKLVLPGSRRDFGRNALVIITPADSPIALRSLADLQKPEFKRVALGKPETVPAGRYAKGALDAAKLWPIIEPKAVFAGNVRQALDYVARGEVEAGFVYATDAAIQRDKVKIAFTVPTGTPIHYTVAVLAEGRDRDTASKFVDYLSAPAGQAVLARFGFQKP
ncbi:molybdate ABC transporter substrate-binding protein [Roseateles sp.]|uniref:molybdate ABC transporter substrate-binding protein n=1 Tax=Roseateles sp. TaxID=1971397 RepID=UPI003BA7E45C